MNFAFITRFLIGLELGVFAQCVFYRSSPVSFKKRISADFDLEGCESKSAIHAKLSKRHTIIALKIAYCHIALMLFIEHI